MNELIRKRLREKLGESIHEVRTASTRQATHVMQREDGAILSNRTGWFTFALADDAMHASENAEPIFGAKPVPVQEARKRIVDVLQEAQSSL